MMSKEVFYKVLCWELHISRLSFSHHNWRAFCYTPWLPQKPVFQWIYLVYRWIVAMYFLTHQLWYLIDGIQYYFIYISNWAFSLLTIYLVWSAISVTLRYMEQILPWCERLRAKQEMIDMNIKLSDKPVGCCCSHNTLRWYELIHWVLFVLGGDCAIAITLLFWIVIFPSNPSRYNNYGSFTTHLINFIVTLFDIWITRLPVRIYHVIYPIFLASTYAMFTGLYFVGGGGNAYDNGTYIYSQLDYENTPGFATGLAISCAFLLVPLVHLFAYFNYLLREGLLYLVTNKCFKYLKNDNEIEV